MSLSAWVNEQLIGFLGFAEPSVVAFAVSVAKQSPGADACAEQLSAVCELPLNDATRKFAAELYARVPRATASAAAAAKPQVQAYRCANLHLILFFWLSLSLSLSLSL